MPTLDLSGIKGMLKEADKPPAEGDHIARCEKADWAKTQKNKDGIIKDMLKVRYKIMAGAEKGKTLFNQLVISPENPSAIQIFKRHVLAHGIAEQQLIEDTENLNIHILGTFVTATVEHREWKGEVRAGVKTYSKCDLDAGTLAELSKGVIASTADASKVSTTVNKQIVMSDVAPPGIDEDIEFEIEDDE